MRTINTEALEGYMLYIEQETAKAREKIEYLKKVSKYLHHLVNDIDGNLSIHATLKTEKATIERSIAGLYRSLEQYQSIRQGLIRMDRDTGTREHEIRIESHTSGFIQQRVRCTPEQLQETIDALNTIYDNELIKLFWIDNGGNNILYQRTEVAGKEDHRGE